MNRSASMLILIVTILVLISGCASAPVEQTPPQPEIETETSPPPPPQEPEKVSKPVEEPEFLITEEVYQETFSDIELLIEDLNTIIQAEDYTAWKSYLTSEYIATYSDPEKLQEISQQPILKKFGIRLRSIEDYFFYVVVPSRSQARLDDITFENNTRVKAIMLINGKRSILYILEKRNNAWKIGV